MARNSNGLPPTYIQAGIYTEVAFYLKAIQAAGTDNADKVVAQMRTMKINDFMTKNGWLREDGRVMRDMYLEEINHRRSRNIHSPTSKYLRPFLQKKPSDPSRKEDARSYMIESGCNRCKSVRSCRCAAVSAPWAPASCLDSTFSTRERHRPRKRRTRSGWHSQSIFRPGRPAAEPQDTCHFRRLLPHPSPVPARWHSPVRANRVLWRNGRLRAVPHRRATGWSMTDPPPKKTIESLIVAERLAPAGQNFKSSCILPTSTSQQPLDLLSCSALPGCLPSGCYWLDCVAKPGCFLRLDRI